MEQLPQAIVKGVALGGMYAVLVLGFSVIWGVMGVINIAHGEFVMVGAYLAWLANDALGRGPVRLGARRVRTHGAAGLRRAAGAGEPRDRPAACWLVVLPLLDGTSNATLLTLTLMFTSVGVAINWNLTGGFTGYVDFGHAVWFGIGAYTAAIMMSLQANGLGIGWPPVPAMALGAAVAGALGLGTVAGPVVGSVGLYWLREVLWANLLDYRLIAQGVLLILIVLFLPRGIVGLFDRRGASVRHLWRVRRPPAADRPEEAGT